MIRAASSRLFISDHARMAAGINTRIDDRHARVLVNIIFTAYYDYARANMMTLTIDDRLRACEYRGRISHALCLPASREKRLPPPPTPRIDAFAF